ncbi:DUF7139 domain-containing protein [Halopenitus persicus]|uniref:Cell division protein A N-terminal domain-containing protein n=1 Tax=Halopenitus persicus TaxID=1048396 RepID=A0A1H3IJE7_9EURY|nr:hypothetical protein [Halopenitus persicus]SDY27188.1 hypothetical protein SAMN05216564_104132 [Halopenitus persicus]
MTSLSEVYGGRGRSTTSLRRLYLGVALFAVGILLIVAGILAAGTDLIPSMEAYSLADARWYGGILGGTGLPLAMLGVMSVLPAGRRTRASAVVGASIMALGVVVFSYAYPYHWVNSPRPELVDLTLPTAGIYFLGGATVFWCLFVGVANFKTRNDPGGTVTLEVTHKGETKVVEVDRRQLDEFGGVGLLGGTPDGSVETQTNDPDANTLGGNGAEVSHATPDSATDSTPDSAGADSATDIFDDASSAGSGSSAAASSGGPVGPGAASVSDGGSDPESIRTPTGSAEPSTTTDRSSAGGAGGAGDDDGFSTDWPDPGRNRTGDRERDGDQGRSRNRSAGGSSGSVSGRPDDPPAGTATDQFAASNASTDDEDVEFIE